GKGVLHVKARSSQRLEDAIQQSRGRRGRLGRVRQRGARHPIVVSARAKASQGSNRLVPRARSSRRCVELPCCAPTARLSMRARTSWSGRRQLCKFCPPLRAAAMHLTASPKHPSPAHLDAAVRRGRWFAQGYVATPGGNAVRALVAVGQTGSGPIAIKPVIKTRDHEDDVGANGSARNPGIIACNKKNREHGNGAHCIYVL